MNQGFDDGEKNFLTDFLGVLEREIGGQLENEAAGRRVVGVEQIVPSRRVAAPAACQQFVFRIHAALTLFRGDAFEKFLRGSIFAGLPSDWV